MSKVRLVGGPFGGKIVKGNFQEEMIYRGPKKMTRAKQYEYFREQTDAGSFMPFGTKPQVEARYRVALRVHSNSTQMMQLPCMHPDGSIFYEYVEGSKREWRNF